MKYVFVSVYTHMCMCVWECVHVRMFVLTSI